MYFCQYNNSPWLNNKSELIQRVRNLAERGQVTNSAGFSIRTDINRVIPVFGPLKTYTYLGTTWQGYDHLKFHLQENLINAIISSDPILQGLTVQDVIQTLGQPTSPIKSTKNYGDRLSYEIPSYKLDFLIPTQTNPGTLGHPVVIVSHAY